MSTFSVGAFKFTDNLKNTLIKLSPIKDFNKGNYMYYTLNLPSEELENLSSILADFIINNMEDILVFEIIKQQYYYFNHDERKIIYKKSKEVLNPNNYNEKNLYYSNRRKKRVKERINIYLQYNNEINLDGFIRFRLKSYYRELEIAVEEAVDDYLMEKEYDEFIRLLKYFVEVQEPKRKIVHVVLEENGFFNLFDGNNNLINNDYLEGFIVELIDEDVNYEDLLISALITIAPENIILHQSQNSQNCNTIKTIKKVFGDKVEDCKGCKMCNHLKNKNK
jgi:putative sporulation protein YtxC